VLSRGSVNVIVCWSSANPTSCGSRYITNTVPCLWHTTLWRWHRPLAGRSCFSPTNYRFKWVE